MATAKGKSKTSAANRNVGARNRTRGTTTAKRKAATKKAVKRKVAKKSAANAVPKKRTTRKAVTRTTPAERTRPRAKKTASNIQEFAFRAEFAMGRGSNRALLYRILRASPTDDRALDPPFDGAARGLLAGAIQNEGVQVSTATIIACQTVGCVVREMGRVNPGGRD